MHASMCPCQCVSDYLPEYFDTHDLARVRASASSEDTSIHLLVRHRFDTNELCSLADLYVRAPLCDLFELGQFEGVPPAFFEAFPRVRDCGQAVLEHPLLKEYHQHYKN